MQKYQCNGVTKKGIRCSAHNSAVTPEEAFCKRHRNEAVEAFSSRSTSFDSSSGGENTILENRLVELARICNATPDLVLYLQRRFLDIRDGAASMIGTALYDDIDAGSSVSAHSNERPSSAEPLPPSLDALDALDTMRKDASMDARSPRDQDATAMKVQSIVKPHSASANLQHLLQVVKLVLALMVAIVFVRVVEQSEVPIVDAFADVIAEGLSQSKATSLDLIHRLLGEQDESASKVVVKLPTAEAQDSRWW